MCIRSVAVICKGLSFVVVAGLVLKVTVDDMEMKHHVKEEDWTRVATLAVISRLTVQNSLQNGLQLLLPAVFGIRLTSFLVVPAEMKVRHEKSSANLSQGN